MSESRWQVVTGHRALAAGALIALAAAACAEGPTGPGGSWPRPSLDRAEPTFRLTSIDVPDATSTVPQGINAAGHVVGFYATAGGRVHGFLMKGGDFTTIDHPGAFFTDARGIGPNDEVVGTYAGQTEPAVAYHGYELTAQGEFVSLHYPGHLYEILQRVLPEGAVVGCRHDQNTSSTMKGVVIAAGGDSEIAAYASMNNGATPDLGRIVGNYVNTSAGNRSEGYTIDDGVFTPFLVPGSTATMAWDVGPRGDVVGVYRNAAGYHGYVRTEAGYTTIDYPGASATRAFGTNARGDVVGTYVAGGVTHGFLAMRIR